MIYLIKKAFVVLIALLTVSCNTTKEYYDTGVLKAKGSILAGERAGEWKQYYENGELFQLGNYVKGKEDGLWKIFHENGQLRQLGHFTYGQQTGTWRFFHPNGNKEGVGELIKGKRNGIWTWYHPNETLFTEREWDHGKLINIYSCFDDQGSKLNPGTLKNGTGTMIMYNPKGMVLDTYTYINGEYRDD